MTSTQLVVNPLLRIQPHPNRFAATLPGRPRELTLSPNLFAILASFTEPHAPHEVEELLRESFEFGANGFEEIISGFVELGVLVTWSPKLSWPGENRTTPWNSLRRGTAALRWSVGKFLYDGVQAARVFRRRGDEPDFVNYLIKSWRVSTAKNIVIRRNDAGLFENYLMVLDVCRRARDDAAIFVDWTIDGTEKHFRYGTPGQNVWNELFAPLAPGIDPASPFVTVDVLINPMLYNIGRDLMNVLPHGRLLRHDYASLVAQHARVINPYVAETVAHVAQRMQGRRCLGVHKRLSGAIAAFQLDGRTPSSAEFLARAEATLRELGEGAVVYLATDDAEAAQLFSARLGDRVICRADVLRLLPGNGEVHRQPWNRVGLKEACDVLIDVLLLARCEELLHVSSNVSTAVSVINPEIKMVRC